MDPVIVLASTNAGKLAELRAILTEAIPTLDPAHIVDASSVGAPDVIEDGVTFEANALKKATQIAQATGLIAVADDSGLTVDVMHGAPGIFSARWAGQHGNDQANMELLLAQIADIDVAHRGAAFVCAAALATPDGTTRHVEFGERAGALTFEPRGEHGFGYDPILEIPELGKTAAELDPATKNAMSHRGKAFRALAPHVAGVLEKA